MGDNAHSHRPAPSAPELRRQACGNAAAPPLCDCPASGSRGRPVATSVSQYTPLGQPLHPFPKWGWGSPGHCLLCPFHFPTPPSSFLCLLCTVGLLSAPG